MSSPMNNDLQDLTRFLTPQERDEMEAILAATPEPIEIILTIASHNGSAEEYLLMEPGGTLRELTTDEMVARGLEPTTPEANGG